MLYIRIDLANNTITCNKELKIVATPEFIRELTDQEIAHWADVATNNVKLEITKALWGMKDFLRPINQHNQFNAGAQNERR